VKSIRGISTALFAILVIVGIICSQSASTRVIRGGEFRLSQSVALGKRGLADGRVLVFG